jgi:tyrosyl-tRNA synthetase
MTTKLTIDEKLALIVKDTVETIAIDELKERLLENKQITIYWGTEPTRSPSLGYLIPMLKLRDLVIADLNVIIFIADVHAFLNKGVKLNDRIEQRVNYYKFLINKLLSRIGVEEQLPSGVINYTFVKGSDVQFDRSYVLDLYRFMASITIKQAKKSGSEVVKQDKDPKISSIVYPLMQVLDEHVLEADLQLGGLDQRKIFALSRDMAMTIGHKKCAYIMNPLLPSLKKANMTHSPP